MKIALYGYGKMGKTIEALITSGQFAHEVVVKIDSSNAGAVTPEMLRPADVAIEFSHPGAAVANISKCFEAGVPVVCGTTGWLKELPEVKRRCLAGAHTLFYAPNFSIGVNLFFALTHRLGQLVDPFPAYDLAMDETHHLEKKDAPSGTAVHLAEELLQTVKRKKQWVNDKSDRADDLVILSHREAEVPGTHRITCRSALDAIEIKHTAFSRKGFAIGALKAAEWVAGRSGYFEMKDLLASVLGEAPPTHPQDSGRR